MENPLILLNFAVPTRTMSIPFIKITKKASSKTDAAYRVAQIFCLMGGIQLSETELKVLAYFMVYGLSDKTKEMVLQAKILTFHSLKNTLTKFRKAKLVFKNEREEDLLTGELKIPQSDITGVLIKIDNR